MDLRERHQFQNESARCARTRIGAQIIAGRAMARSTSCHRPRRPHRYEKDKEFDYAPNGILGLEKANGGLDVSVRQNKFKIIRVIDLMKRSNEKL